MIHKSCMWWGWCLLWGGEAHHTASVAVLLSLLFLLLHFLLHVKHDDPGRAGVHAANAP